jgi:hypothetical protein
MTPFFLLCLLSPLNPPGRAQHQSKQIATPPTLTLLSSSNLGTFPATGPISDVEFSISISGSSLANWRYYIRVDSEGWSYTGNVTADVWTTTLRPAFFYGARLSVGAHSVQRLARDNSSVASNTVSLSYAISAPTVTPTVTPSGGVSTGAAVGIAVGVVVLVGLIIAVAVVVRSRKAMDNREASALSASLTVGGDKEAPRGPQVYGVQPAYPPPFQPTGAYPPFQPQPGYPPYPGDGVPPYSQTPYGGPR